MSLLKLVNVSAGYGKIEIIHDLSLNIEAGESVGIIGSNGMGKTTLLKAIVGLIKIKQGQVMFQDLDIGSTPTYWRARNGIGYVPQGRGIMATLTVLENLEFSRLTNRGDCWEIGECIDEFPRLKRFLNRRGGSLSGGEQQLLALARALIRKPKILLLDEPTEGIQPSIVQEMVEKIDRLRKEMKLTIILVEQNVDFIEQLVDRAVVINKGRVVRFLTSDGLNGFDFNELGLEIA